MISCINKNFSDILLHIFLFFVTAIECVVFVYHKITLQHEGQPYCNVPCYSMLFSSLKSSIREAVDSHGEQFDGLSMEQKKFRYAE